MLRDYGGADPVAGFFKALAMVRDFGCEGALGLTAMKKMLDCPDDAKALEMLDPLESVGCESTAVADAER
jgi:hypothetical protein